MSPSFFFLPQKYTKHLTSGMHLFCYALSLNFDQSFVSTHGEVNLAGSFSGAALKFLTYTPGLSCSSFQCEPLSVRPECIRFSIGNAVLKILAWLKVYTDRSLNSPPCDDLPSSQGHLVLCWQSNCICRTTVTLYCRPSASLPKKMFRLTVCVVSEK